MPNTIRIEGKEFVLLKKEFTAKDLYDRNNLPEDKNLASNYEEIRDFMENNPQYKTIEEVVDKFSADEIAANKQNYINEIDSAVEAKYAEQIKQLQAKAKQEVKDHYINKARNLFQTNLENLDGAFKGTWGMPVDDLVDKVCTAVKGEDEVNSVAFDDAKALQTIQEIANTLNDPEAKVENHVYYDTLQQYSKEVNAIVNYINAKNNLSSELENVSNYINQTVAEDPENIYKKTIDSDPLTVQMNKEKEGGYKKMETDEEISSRIFLDKWNNLKKVHDYNNEYKKTAFKQVMQERNDLEARYNKTTLLSRIVSKIPFIKNLSEAGKIQNEIDKIDKAVKEAGFNEKDVQDVQKEIADDAGKVEINERDETSKNIAIEDDSQLHNKLGRDLSQSQGQISEKVNESSQEKVAERNQ